MGERMPEVHTSTATGLVILALLLLALASLLRLWQAVKHSRWPGGAP